MAHPLVLTGLAKCATDAEAYCSNIYSDSCGIKSFFDS